MLGNIMNEVKSKADEETRRNLQEAARRTTSRKNIRNCGGYWDLFPRVSHLVGARGKPAVCRIGRGETETETGRMGT